MGLKGIARRAVVRAVKPFPPARRKVRQVVNNYRGGVYDKIKRGTVTNDKLVVFESYRGRSYSDSPRAIYKEMLRDPKCADWQFVWAVRREVLEIMPEVMPRTRVVRTGTPEYYQAYAQAKYWVTNSRLPAYLHPRADQMYIQAWHGTALKRLSHDIEVGDNAMWTRREMLEKDDADTQRYAAMISPSPFMTGVYRSAFDLENLGKGDIVWETGYPRNDRLVNAKKSEIEILKQQYNIPADKKVILYAPTWRDNQHKSGAGYTYETAVDFDLLQEKLGRDYIILFRAHYFIVNEFDFEKYAGFIYDVSKVNEISDLYLISDILITDYSSVFFDYALLRRPIIFYMYDRAEYRDVLHGFYLDEAELPGPIVETADELVRAVKHAKPAKNLKEFLKKYAPLEDGKSAQRVVKKIRSKK